jgi:hypothetical protein
MARTAKSNWRGHKAPTVEFSRGGYREAKAILAWMAPELTSCS